MGHVIIQLAAVREHLAVSIREVAQLAGVSTSTVSRVINDRPNVAARTVASVKRVMGELSFSPVRRSTPSSRGGDGMRTATIAFLVFGTSGSQPAPAFEKLLRGVSGATSQRDLSLIFSFVSDPSQLPPRIINRRVDGILLHGERPSSSVQAKLEPMPTVWLMANRQRPLWGDQVMPDNTAIGELAAKYLLQRGHRHVAYLSSGWGSWSFEIRSLAFCLGIQDGGGKVELLEATEDRAQDFWSRDGLMLAGDALVDRLAALNPRPTAIFIAEDKLLPVVDAALARRGIRCGPGEGLELISCNNERPHFTGLHTSPATIDIRAESIGRRGVEHLLWRLRHIDVDERIRKMVEPVLVVPGEES
jgi:LacI family transcriptional regulator